MRNSKRKRNTLFPARPIYARAFNYNIQAGNAWFNESAIIDASVFDKLTAKLKDKAK